MKKVQLLLTFELENASIKDKHDVVSLHNSVYDALSNPYIFSSREKCDIQLITDIDTLYGNDVYKDSILIDDKIAVISAQLDPKPEVSPLFELKLVRRPWGTFETLFEDYKCKIKQIVVWPGQSLSLQSHNKRDEFWKLIQGEGEVIIDGCTLEANSDSIPYSYFIIRRGMQHRITNTGPENLVFIEIQTGESFAEDDIIRYADQYGRV